MLTLHAFITIGQRHQLVPPGKIPFHSISALREASRPTRRGSMAGAGGGAARGKKKRTILSGYDEKARAAHTCTHAVCSPPCVRPPLRAPTSVYTSAATRRRATRTSRTRGTSR